MKTYEYTFHRRRRSDYITNTCTSSSMKTYSFKKKYENVRAVKLKTILPTHAHVTAGGDQMAGCGRSLSSAVASKRLHAVLRRQIIND